MTSAAGGDASADATKIRRLQPLRVVLAGQDRRYLRVTEFLLARRGYEVTRASVDNTVETADRARADVVVLELGPSKVAAARTIAALQTAAASPAVMLVMDGDEPTRWKGLESFSKWVPIEELVRKLETAALTRVAPAAPLRPPNESRLR
jgi:DNA-binding response OmpR family regulator